MRVLIQRVECKWNGVDINDFSKRVRKPKLSVKSKKKESQGTDADGWVNSGKDLQRESLVGKYSLL